MLLPMAPASTVVERFVLGLPEVLCDYGLDPRFAEAEVAAMADHRLDKTASRSVLGVMNEFTHMADDQLRHVDDIELMELALWLAQVPCGPLFKSHVSPDRDSERSWRSTCRELSHHALSATLRQSQRARSARR